MGLSICQLPSAKFPMQELEEVESAIKASRQWLSSLETRRDRLMDELDQLTKPSNSHTKLPTIGPGYVLRGQEVRHWNYIYIYLGVLRQLWQEFPDARDAMAEAMARCGVTRCYVARSVETLFQGKSMNWARKFSRPLVDGWYADTNMSLERMRRVLPMATKAAGLEWGKDLKVYWSRVKANS